MKQNGEPLTGGSDWTPPSSEPPALSPPGLMVPPAALIITSATPCMEDPNGDENECKLHLYAIHNEYIKLTRTNKDKGWRVIIEGSARIPTDELLRIERRETTQYKKNINNLVTYYSVQQCSRMAMQSYQTYTDINNMFS